MPSRLYSNYMQIDPLQLTDDAPGDSFSFVSTDDAGNLSSLQVTALVARALKDVLVKAKPAGAQIKASKGDPCSRVCRRERAPG